MSDTRSTGVLEWSCPYCGESGQLGVMNGERPEARIRAAHHVPSPECVPEDYWGGRGRDGEITWRLVSTSPAQR